MTTTTKKFTTKELIDKMANFICNPSRDNLSKPMWKNNRVGISNEHIGIVFNDIEYCPKWMTNNDIVVDRLFGFCDKEGDLISVKLPEINPDPTWLNPFGEIKGICSECGGSGTVTCNFDHDHECPECDGSGKATDYAVFSSKNKKLHENIELPSVGLFNERYLWIISQLAKYRQLQYSIVKLDNHIALKFSFEDGSGVLMSLVHVE